METDIASLVMYDDVNVCVRYTPIPYEIKFYYTAPGSGEDTVKTYVFPYGYTIESVPEELYNEIAGYYPEKYYSVEWYSNRSLDVSKLVSFPQYVRGAVSFYAKPVELPYTVVFRVDNGSDVISEEKEVMRGAFVIITARSISATPRFRESRRAFRAVRGALTTKVYGISIFSPLSVRPVYRLTISTNIMRIRYTTERFILCSNPKNIT